LEDVNSLLIQQLNKLSPFGIGNPKPIFAFRNVLPQAVELFGKIKEHTKLVFQTENGKLEAIAFFQKPEQFTKVPSVDVPLTMIGHVEQSFFMGHRQLRVRIIDLI
jgi:single-stranded-DNA-specific exonuclease